MFGTPADGIDLFEYISLGLTVILVITAGVLGRGRSQLKQRVDRVQRLLDGKTVDLAARSAELVQKEGVIQQKDTEITRLTADRDRYKSHSQVRFNEHQKLEAEKAEVLLELEYWRDFAGRVFHDSTSHLAKARAYVSRLPNDDRGPVLDGIDFSLAALSLAAADDCAEMLQRTRIASAPFNALPNLRRFASDWGRTLGQRFRATLPDPKVTLIFLGQWAHLEILFTNLFQNAHKHSSIPDAPIEFVCTTKDHFACFEMTNSAVPVHKTFMNASTKIQVDGRKRFGLHLMEQIVSGYSGYIDYNNLPAEAKLPPRVRVTIRLPMDG